jgi:hypothetical protein
MTRTPVHDPGPRLKPPTGRTGVEEAESVKAVDLHDARLECIIARTDESVEVRFARICMLRGTAEGRRFVWSYTAVLKLLGVFKFEIGGGLSQRDYVSDGQVTTPLGQEVDLVRLIEEDGGPGAVDLSFGGSGARLRVEFSACRLVDLSPIRELTGEDWPDSK